MTTLLFLKKTIDTFILNFPVGLSIIDDEILFFIKNRKKQAMFG